MIENLILIGIGIVIGVLISGIGLLLTYRLFVGRKLGQLSGMIDRIETSPFGVSSMVDDFDPDDPNLKIGGTE